MLNSLQLKKKTERKELYKIHILSLLTVSFFHLWILPRMPDVTDSSPTEGGLVRKKAVITFHII